MYFIVDFVVELWDVEIVKYRCFVAELGLYMALADLLWLDLGWVEFEVF